MGERLELLCVASLGGESPLGGRQFLAKDLNLRLELLDLHVDSARALEASLLQWRGGLIRCDRHSGILFDLEPGYLLLRLAHGFLEQVPLRLRHRRSALHLREVCTGRLELRLQLDPLLLPFVFELLNLSVRVFGAPLVDGQFALRLRCLPGGLGRGGLRL